MQSRCWLVASLLLVTLSVTFRIAHGQAVVVQQGAGGGSRAYNNPQGQSLPFLWGPQIEKELDIVDTQREALAKIRNDVVAKMRTLYDTNIPDQQERMKKYNEASQALGEETEKKVLDVLLPHQIKRLKQITLQMQLQQTGFGMSAAFQNSQVAEDLKVTDEQKAQLVEKQKEVAKEMQEKTQAFYKQLQEESREKMLSVLTPAQRRKLDELTGEQFQWQPRTPAPANPVVPGGKLEELRKN